MRWSVRGSNPRPPACKAGALPAELTPQESLGAISVAPPQAVGLERFELSTPRLSSVCSNQLSYRPRFCFVEQSPHQVTSEPFGPSKPNSKTKKNRNFETDLTRGTPKSSPCLQKGGDPAAGSPTATLLRLHPSYQSLLRDLPPLRVGEATSGATDSHGVTGGVYKARERIHPCLLIRDY